MPIFEWKCARDGYTDEHIMSYSRSESIEVICPHCGDAMQKMVSLISKTPTAWHGNWSDGLGSSMYSQALGHKVSNKREEERIMNARGFVNEKDLGPGFVENFQSKIVEKRKKQDEKADIYNKVLKETGSEAQAVEKAFPAHEALDGTLDKIYGD